VHLLGEGTFHQFHGGVATNVPAASHPFPIFHEEYVRLRGEPFAPPTALPVILGTRLLDEANVIVALTSYTAALLVRAVLAALDSVPAQVGQAATALGYSPLTRIMKVELPLSIPNLIAGLRVVVVTNIAMVSVGSVIGIGGLGAWFTEGYNTDKSDQIVAGILVLSAIAVVIDGLIVLAGRAATPWTRATR
jgi:osmoprotectant transport system permease protein